MKVNKNFELGEINLIGGKMLSGTQKCNCGCFKRKCEYFTLDICHNCINSIETYPGSDFIKCLKQ